LEYLSSDAYTIEIYKAREKSLHERANMISSAKEEGKIEGKMEGKIEGKMEGKIEGKIVAARNMIIRGMGADMVAEVTELTLDEVENIKKQISDTVH
jgi:predicted transposase/invertase (TIGR01784 family)